MISEKTNSSSEMDLDKFSNNELKKLVAELVAKNEKMSLLLNDAQKHANSCSFEIDETQQIIWSENAFEIFGFDQSKSEPQVEEFINRIVENDREYVRSSVEMTFTTGKPLDITYRWQCSNNRIKFINSVGGLSTDETTGMKRLSGTSKDVTDNKNIEEEIRKGARKLETIIKTTHDGYFVVNSSGRILECNHAFESMIGYTNEELLKMSLSELDVKENSAEIKEHIKKVSIQGWDQFVTKHKCKNGNIITVEISTTYTNAEEPFLICFARDITSAYLEKELLEARIRLEEFSYNHSLDELLQKTLDEAEALTASKIGFYHFVDDDQENLHLQMWSSNTLENMCTAEGKGSHYPISKAGVWVDCVKTKKPVIHNDYENLKHKKGLPEGHAPVKRELVIPVIRNEKLKAILGVGNKSSNYNSLDIEVVEKLANLAWDIVERKRAEENLKYSESKFKNLFQFLQQGIFYQKSDGSLIDINPAALEMFGITREEFLQRNSYSDKWYVVNEKGEKIEPQDHPSIVALATCKEVLNYQLGVFNPKKNAIVWLTVNAIPQFENVGSNPSHVFVSMHDITKHKMAELELVQSEERWHFALEGSDEGVWDWNVQTGKVYYSKQLQEMLGYQEGEFGDSVEEWKNRVHPDDLEEVLKTLDGYFENKGNIYQSEHRLKCKDGSYLWILDRGKIVEWDDLGNAVRMIGTHADIDKRKKTEAALEEEKRLFNKGKAVVFKWKIVEPEAYVLYVSPNIKEQFGYECELLLDKNFSYRSLIHADDVQRVEDEIREHVYAGERSFEQEYRIKHANGEYRWVYDYTTTEFNDRGEIDHFQGYIYDITQRKLFEQKLSLRESQLSHAMNVARLGHWEYDISSDMLTFNDEFYTFMRTNVEKVGSYQMTSRQYATMFVHPDDRQIVPRAVKEAIDSTEPNKSFRFEHRVIFGDGKIGFIAVQFSVIKNEKGETVKTIGVNQDITEIVLNQHLLKNSEEKYRILFEENKDAIAIFPFDENGDTHNFTQANKTACDLLGYSRVEFLNLLPNDIEANLTKEIIETRMSELLTNGIVLFETELICKSGQRIPTEMKTSLVFIDGKKYLMTIARDITERKIAEEKIKEANINLELAIEAGNLGTFNVNIKTGEKLVNKKYLSMFGYRQGEIEVTTENWRSLIHPEDLPKVIDFTKKLEDGEIQEMEVEYRAKHKSGKWIWISDRAKGFDYDENGKPTRSAGTHKDITHLKEQEEAIRKSEIKYHSLYDAITDAISILEITENDEIGNILEVNEIAAKILGYSKEELLKLSPFTVEHEATPEKFLYRKNQLKIYGKVNFETNFVHKDGHLIPMEVNASMVMFNNKHAVLNLVRDITERKTAESRIRESEKKYRLLAENINDVIWTMDVETEMYSYLSPSAEKLRGFTIAEMINLPVVEAVPTEYREKLRSEWLERTARFMEDPHNKKYYVDEIPQLHKDGHIIWTEVASTFYTNPETQKLEVHGFTKDITERKRANLAIQESEQKFRSYIDNAPDAIFVVDQDGYYKMANNAACELFGYSAEEFKGIRIPQLLHPDDLERGMQHFNTLRQSGKAVGDFRMPKNNGEYVYVTVDAVKLSENTFLGFTKDITKRKMAEIALAESEQRYKSIVSELLVGVTIHIDGVIVFANNSMIKMMGGKNESEFLGRNVMEFVHPEERQMVAEIISKEIQSVDTDRTDTLVIEERLIKLDGSIINVEASAIAINYYGKKALMVMINDVTEKKKAQSALVENEKNLDTFFNTVQDFLWVLNDKGEVISFNKTVEERLGYSIDELKGTSILYVHPEQKRDEALQIVQEMLQGKRDTCPIPIQTKDGKIIAVETYISMGTWNGEPALFGVSKDITVLKLSEEKFAKAFHNSPVIIGISDLELGGFIEVNQEFINKFEYSLEEIRGKKSTELLKINKEMRESAVELLKLTGSIKNVEAVAISKSGRSYNLLLSAEVIEINGKEYNYTTAVDITERKKAEVALAENQQKLQSIFDTMEEGLALNELVYDQNGEIEDYRIIEVNNAFGKLTGIDKDFAIGKLATELYKMPNEYIKRFWAEHLYSDNEIKTIMYIEQANVWFHISTSHPINGKFVTSFFDVTDIKKAETLLKESEQNLVTLINATPDIICFKDGEGRWLKANEGILSLYELGDVDYVGKTEWELAPFTHPIYQEGFKTCGETDEIAWKFGLQSRSEEVIPRANGEKRTYDIIKIPIFNENGSRKALVVFGRDITERKSMENELRESEDKFRKSFMTSPDAVNINRMSDGLYIEINEGFTKMTGFTLEDVMGKTSSEISIWANPEDRNRLVQDLLENGSCTNLEAQFRFKDGSLHTGLMSAAPLMVRGEKCILSITRDITERKNAETALKESEEKFKALFEMSPDAVFVHAGGNIMYANKSTVKLLKYPTLEELQQTSIFNIVPPDNHKTVYERIRLLREEENKILPFYGKFVCYDGSLADVEIVVTELTMQGNKAIQILARDVSDRIKNEQRIKFQRDMNVALIKAKNLMEASKTIFTYARLLLEVDGGGLYLKTADGGIKLFDSFGLSEKFLKSVQYHAADTYNVQMIQSGNAVFANFDMIKKSTRKEMQNEGIKAAAAIPLIFEGKIAAVLNLASRTLEEYNEQQKKYIETFALMCGAFVGRIIAEQELRASEDKFRKFFEADLAGDYTSLADGTLLECNNAFVKILEFSSKEEALSTNMKDIYPREEKRNSFLNKLKKNKSLELIETRLITKRGREVIVLENVLADYDEKGKFLGATGYMIDVTKLKVSEKALIESERNYRELFRRMQSGFALHEIIVNRKGKPVNYRFISVNPKFEKLTGLKSKDILGKTVLEVMPQTEKYWIETYGKVALSGKPITYENYAKEIGKYYKVVAYSPERNKFATIIEDITEAKIAEGKIRQLSTAVEQSSVAVVITDKDGIIEYINPMYSKITGYTKLDVIGKRILIESDNSEDEKLNIQILNKIKAGKDWFGTYRNKKKSGDYYWESSTISPVRDSEGRITHYISIREDISERKAKDQELESYKNHLEDEVDLRTRDLQYANIKLNEEIVKQKNTEELLKVALSKEKELSDLKTRFISTTSHEFRTPLTSILSSTDLLQKYGKKWTEGKFTEHADRTRRAVEYLVKLLDDILTISRTESGKINFAPSVVELRTFCKDIIAEAKPSASSKHKITLKYNPKQTEFMLDAKLLKFILLNLLVNAIKYSPNGGEVKLVIASDKRNLIFNVSDQGIGIPSEEKAHVFDNFYRSKNSVDIPGTGLGLAIVKKSVELHKGSISFVSQINVGTTFVVTLPKSYSGGEE